MIFFDDELSHKIIENLGKPQFEVKGPLRQGWQCPVCRQVYAPFVMACQDCGKEPYMTTMSGKGME